MNLQLNLLWGQQAEIQWLSLVDIQYILNKVAPQYEAAQMSPLRNAHFHSPYFTKYGHVHYMYVIDATLCA